MTPRNPSREHASANNVSVNSQQGGRYRETGRVPRCVYNLEIKSFSPEYLQAALRFRLG